jgi:hypothetical protein
VKHRAGESSYPLLTINDEIGISDGWSIDFNRPDAKDGGVRWSFEKEQIADWKPSVYAIEEIENMGGPPTERTLEVRDTDLAVPNVLQERLNRECACFRAPFEPKFFHVEGPP